MRRFNPKTAVLVGTASQKLIPAGTRFVAAIDFITALDRIAAGLRRIAAGLQHIAATQSALLLVRFVAAIGD